MREIKFRSWGYCLFSEKWRMLEWDKIKNNCMAYFVNPEKFGQNNPNKEPHKIMQFTGLKDKNGMDIYEGDVLEYYGGRRLVEFTPSDGLMLAFIYSNDFEIEGIVQTHEQCNYTKCVQCKVIGNIHDNPELLQ